MLNNHRILPDRNLISIPNSTRSLYGHIYLYKCSVVDNNILPFEPTGERRVVTKTLSGKVRIYYRKIFRTFFYNFIYTV